MKNRQIHLQILQIEDKMERLKVQRNFLESLLKEDGYRDEQYRNPKTQDTNS